MRKSLILEDADEALLHGDAAMPANCAEPGANLVVVAPFEVVLAELAALIADGVLGARPARLAASSSTRQISVPVGRRLKAARPKERRDQ
ncbi:MAG TPA: hypothetical protein VF550_00905, partial [Polyangia bacterium]